MNVKGVDLFPRVSSRRRHLKPVQQQHEDVTPLHPTTLENHLSVARRLGVAASINHHETSRLKTYTMTPQNIAIIVADSKPRREWSRKSQSGSLIWRVGERPGFTTIFMRSNGKTSPRVR